MCKEVHCNCPPVILAHHFLHFWVTRDALTDWQINCRVASGGLN